MDCNMTKFQPTLLARCMLVRGTDWSEKRVHTLNVYRYVTMVTSQFFCLFKTVAQSLFEGTYRPNLGLARVPLLVSISGKHIGPSSLLPR